VEKPVENEENRASLKLRLLTEPSYYPNIGNAPDDIGQKKALDKRSKLRVKLGLA
jgi:hypothetical protein